MASVLQLQAFAAEPSLKLVLTNVFLNVLPTVERIMEGEESLFLPL